MASTTATPPPPNTTTTTTTTNPPDLPTSTLTKTKQTLQYLYDPTTSPSQPSHLRTRSLLRTLRYLTIFLFWRLFRYAKYAATGALVTAVAGTAIGSVVSGAAFVIAPTGILGGAGVGVLWAVGRFGWRRARARVERRGGNGHREGDARRDEQADAVGEEERPVVGVPRTEPW